MAETIRLNKVLRELNISLDRAVEFLDSKGIEIEKRPTTKISQETYDVLADEFQTDADKKMASQEVSEAKQKEKEALREQREREELEREKAKNKEVIKAATTLSGPKQVGKIDLDADKKKVVKPKKEEEKTPEKPKAVEVEKPVIESKEEKVGEKYQKKGKGQV